MNYRTSRLRQEIFELIIFLGLAAFAMALPRDIFVNVALTAIGTLLTTALLILVWAGSALWNQWRGHRQHG